MFSRWKVNGNKSSPFLWKKTHLFFCFFNSLRTKRPCRLSLIPSPVFLFTTAVRDPQRKKQVQEEQGGREAEELPEEGGQRGLGRLL